jgi:hypothetical protein
MDHAAIAAAAAAANQASMFGAALRMNMATTIAANLAPTLVDENLSTDGELVGRIDQVADIAVQLADAVMRRCQQPPTRS